MELVEDSHYRSEFRAVLGYAHATNWVEVAISWGDPALVKAVAIELFVLIAKAHLLWVDRDPCLDAHVKELIE